MAKEEKQKKSSTKGGSASGGGYTSQNITVLEGLDPVRKRPGMYIGSTGSSGLHHLIWEVVDNSIDEAMSGYCTTIAITLLPNNRVSVTDNGRGIPVDIHKQFKVSALELVLTKLHAGGKFGGGGYKVSGGLHGVGVSVVNALSTMMRAEVRRDGKLWVQEYQRGKPRAKVKSVGNARGNGTTITFDADPEIFPVIAYDWQTVIDHLRQQAYLTKGVTITVADERISDAKKTYVFYFEGGIKSYVRHLNHHKEKKHDAIFYVDKEAEGKRIEIALQYVGDFKETVLAFANNIFNPEGGTHVVGFRTSLTRTLNNYARTKGFLKEKDENLSGEDTREGLTAVISVKLQDPQFEGQTKAKLGNDDIRTLVDTVFSETLATFLEEHPRDGEAIIGKCLLAARARLAARAARDSVLRKGALEGLMLPGKLADCSSRDAKNTELFIVEGDSAGGSCKMGRNREFQAILPLRGKILNVERARIDKMLANNELRALIIALGTNIGEQFNLAELRYDRIIIATDADVDGSHIRTLLLTLFWRYLPEIIKTGHLYIAQPPLYRIQKGKDIRYAYTDEEKEKTIKELSTKGGSASHGPPTGGVSPLAGRAGGEKSIKTKEPAPLLEARPDRSVGGEGESEVTATPTGISIQRYKGLGEMNPEQLWETTMDPAQRVLKQVTVDDAEKADEIFDILMGSEVEPRKHFIHAHAKNVKNLDI